MDTFYAIIKNPLITGAIGYGVSQWLESRKERYKHERDRKEQQEDKELQRKQTLEDAERQRLEKQREEGRANQRKILENLQPLAVEAWKLATALVNDDKIDGVALRDWGNAMFILGPRHDNSGIKLLIKECQSEMENVRFAIDPIRRAEAFTSVIRIVKDINGQAGSLLCEMDNLA